MDSVFKLTSLAEGDGKLLLSAEGSIIDFSVSFEGLVGIPSIEIYGKSVSDFIEFQNFPGRTSAVIFGDAKRFESELALGVINPRIDRHGWIKARSRCLSARIETSSVLVNERRGLAVYYWVVNNQSSPMLVPEGLPTGWGSIATLIVNLWQHERTLFGLGAMAAVASVLAGYYLKFYTITPKMLPMPSVTPTPVVVPRKL